MKKSKIILLVLVISTFIFSCEQASRSGHAESEYASEDLVQGESVVMDSITENSEAPLSSTAATYQDPNRKFIRTADLSMEVENVYKSTTNIERKISEIGGFVTQSNLQSNVISQEIFPIDSDSAKEVKKYTVNNSMTVRVPQLELGNFLLSLGDEIKFLNFRNISAEDVSLSFVMSELEKERLDKTSGKLDKMTDQTGKITDKQDIVNDVDDKHSQINHHKISTMKMKDNVAYSTISLQLTEKEKVAETTMVNLKNYDDKFRPDFWYRAGNSVKDGFYLFQSVCVGVLYLWPLFVTAILVFIGFKWYNKKMRTS